MLRDIKQQLMGKLSLGFLPLFLFLSLFNLLTPNSLLANPVKASTGVAAVTVDISSITVTWTPVNPEPSDIGGIFTLGPEHIQYEIFSTTGSSYLDDGGGDTGAVMLHYTSGRISPRLSSSAVSYTIADLGGPNTGFNLVVISTICNNCIGASFIPQFSSVSLAVTQFTFPNKPTGFSLVSLTTTPDLNNGISTITVSWGANGNPPYTQYSLLLGQSGVDGFSFGQVGSSLTVLNTATFKYAIANATFVVTLAARNGDAAASFTRTSVAADVNITSMSWLAPPRWTTTDVSLSSAVLRIVDNGNDHHDNETAGDGFSDEFDHGVFYEVTYATHPFDVAWSTHPGANQTIYSTGTAFGGQTGISTTTISGLTSNSTYFFRVRAYNQKKNYFSKFYPTISTTSFMTLAAIPSVAGFNVFTTSFTVQLSSNGNSPGTMFSISTSPAFEAHISSRGFTSNSLIAATLSLTNLSTNTVYSLFTISTNAAGAYGSTVTVRASTYTLAAPVTTVSTATATGFVAGIFSFSSAPTNPADTQYAILSSIPENTESVHHGKYFPAIIGGVSDLDNISNTPVGQTYSEWSNGSNISVRNVIGGTNYNFHVFAINGNGIPTSTSPAAAMATFPSGPKVRNKTSLGSGSWINHLTTTFTVSNSIHYHSTFTRNSGDSSTLDAISNFSSFSSSNSYIAHLSSQVVIVTATASGPWYFTSFGDAFGYSNDPTHTRLAVNQFQMNIDTTPSNIGSVTGQFSQTDSEVITSSVTTGRHSPFFQWTFSRVNESLESPATGYSFVFSTDISSAVTDVIHTTGTSVFFSSAARLDGTTYFKIKAKDTAGNWGAISTFTFIYAADAARPTITSTGAVTSAKGSDGRFLAVPVSTTIAITFSEAMKVNATTSASNVLLTGIMDNSGNSQTESTAVGLSYSTDTRILSVTPSSNLNNGWLYRLVITTSVKDTGENGLLAPATVYFQTVMDRTAQNIVSSGAVTATIPIGAIPTGNSISAPPPETVSAQTLGSANTKLRDIIGSFAVPVTIRQFVAKNSAGENFTGNFNSPVTIVMPYTDTNNDGIVDGTSPQIREKVLAVYVLDETNNVWQKVSNATLNAGANTVTFQANHFSYYALFGAPDNDVNGAYAYPVPFKPGSGHANITFTNLPTDGSIRIYTSVGELVKEIKFNVTSGASTYVWDVKDEDGENLGSDVYLYVIESGPNRKKGKIVVIR